MDVVGWLDRDANALQCVRELVLLDDRADEAALAALKHILFHAAAPRLRWLALCGEIADALVAASADTLEGGGFALAAATPDAAARSLRFIKCRDPASAWFDPGFRDEQVSTELRARLFPRLKFANFTSDTSRGAQWVGISGPSAFFRHF
jgi:hypothetical protein